VAEVYSQQSNRAFEAALAARTDCQHAAFLLPHLRPGMHLLDAGCGPGSVTLGLAEAVAPGRVVGIDKQGVLVERAQVLAAARGITTARFEVADVYELPFADHSFDAAFVNGVLMHLREPLRALKQLRRVLRPGGIAGVRDPDWGTTLYVPTTPLLEQWLAMRVRVRQHNGGDPFLSRSYRRLLLEAGFVRVEASASVDSAGSLEGTFRHAAFLEAQLQGLARTVVMQGWLDRRTVDAVATEIKAWARLPEAFAVTTWCEAIGWVSD
jgi:ubiquinone/menaquinone biosynthesis C-methylase UbiE